MTRAKKSSSKTQKLHTKLFIKPQSIKPAEAKALPKLEQLPNADRKQFKKAVDALVGYMKKKVAESEKSDLLAGEDNEDVWLGVTLKRMPPKDNHKPQRIPLPHPLMDPRRNPVCLLVKDPQREYKDLLEEKKIKFISRVVGMEKLQGKFKAFEARRQLMKEHDLFLVDDRIVPEMPRVLGRSWLEAKRSPIPVTLKRADLKAELERAIASTYLRINKGTSVSVKIASLNVHSPSEIYDNLCAAVPYLDTKLPLGGWDNVQSLHIKTTSSIALPIWNCSLDDEEGRFFAPDVNAEQVEAAKKAKEDKDARIKSKRERKIVRKLIEAAEAGESDEEEDDEEEADGEANEEVLAVPADEDASSDVESIDENVEPAAPEETTPAKKTKVVKSKAASKPAASPAAGAERKKVSSTSKKLKGIDTVKGLPKKSKSKKA